MRAPLLSAHSPVRTIDVTGYQVALGAGLREEFAGRIASAAPAHRYAVVSDDNVASHHTSALVSSLGEHGKVSLHLMRAGEASKTRETWSQLTDQLLDAGYGRDTTVVALGGGVVGDMAGFVAATFMRGVPVVQCPTSLLAMIDASIGGKTGVDTPAGKNLVGAFHQPAAVLIDVELLGTLPIEHRRAGLAEAIKHGAIADADYLARLDSMLHAILDADPAAMLDVVGRSVEIKAEFVRADPREGGMRKALNFGHTIGHAIELASDFTLLHGEAVAIGMALEARLGERVGVTESGTAAAIDGVLRRAGLPVDRPAALRAETVLAATRSDKKARGGAVAYALPSRVGAMANAEQGWVVRVEDSAVREVLA